MLINWLWPDGKPEIYNWFHILWIFILIIGVILIIILTKNNPHKTQDKVVFSAGLFLLIFEIVKQIFMVKVNGHYDWYYFPFQYCSIPMYISFIAPLIKNEKIKEIMYKYLASFGLMGGIYVMAYPGACFNTSYMFLLIHTMIWHVSLVWIGIYLIRTKKYGSNIKTIFKELSPAIVLMLLIIYIICIVNTIAYKYYFGTKNNIYDDQFNLFYLSKYYDVNIPVLSPALKVLPYPIVALIYWLVMSTSSTLSWLLTYGIRRIISNKSS